MAKKTIKVGSFVEIQGFKNGHVDDIKNGYYYFNGIDERFTASDLKIIPDPPKPLKRTELKNAENPIAIKKHLHKIRKVSKKRQEQLTVYKVKQHAFLMANTECAVKSKFCTGESTEIHHTKGRENDLLNDVRYFLAICTSCHIFITENSALAADLGFSQKRNT